MLGFSPNPTTAEQLRRRVKDEDVHNPDAEAAESPNADHTEAATDERKDAPF
jgi:hypothetical protein